MAAAWARAVTVVAAVALVGAGAPACSRSAGRPGLLGPGEEMPRGITVTSAAFRAGGEIPERFSCEGENVPPPLAWEGVPAGAGELVVAVEDPDAPDGIFVHWLVVGIDASATALAEGELPAGAEVLPGSSDNPTYIGPCPPTGDGTHRYAFEVYALRRRPVLDPGASPVEKVRALRGSALAGGSITGTFSR